MLTARGWWLLTFVLGTLLAGALLSFLPLALIGLTLLLWFAWEWLRFAVRLRAVPRHLRVERAVWDDRGPVGTLWAGHTFRVRARLELRRSHLPYLMAADLVPFGVEHLDGPVTAAGDVRPGRPLALDYSIRCTGAGRARFEGLRVEAADLQGLFYHAAFVRAPLVLRVLPRLIEGTGQTATTKRYNLLPPPGIHRLRRPGSGSELLDLRDYLPGDPPKTIAWKVSARRDRLITKEFESEVPVRCTLFVDTSNSVRVPSPLPGPAAGAPGAGNALDRLVEIAASVLLTNAGTRDLTGLCLFDEQGVSIVRPSRTRAQVTQMLHLLADAAALTPTAGRADPEALLPLAYSFAQEVYPDLLRPALNPAPFWMTWFLSFPGNPRGRRGFWERLYHYKGTIFVLFSGLLGAGLFWLPELFVPPFALLALGFHSVLESLGTPADVAALAAVLLGLLSVELPPALLYLVTMLVTRRRQRLMSWRKQLAALLAPRHGPGGLGTLLEDDDAFGLLLQRFLGEHQVPYTLPLYDEQGRYLFAAPEKIAVLARALLQAVGKGHDNELFVLLVDLLELDRHLTPLLQAVRVALARHHQVVLVCPWPPGVPPPSAALAGPPRPAANLRDLLGQATAARTHDAYRRLRRAFARLGVPVVCAAGGEPVPLILDRLDRLRAVRRNNRR